MHSVDCLTHPQVMPFIAQDMKWRAQRIQARKWLEIAGMSEKAAFDIVDNLPKHLVVAMSQRVVDQLLSRAGMR